MIKTLKEYEITTEWLKKFNEALVELEANKEVPNVHPILRQAEIDAVKSQIEIFERDLKEYRPFKRAPKGGPQ